MRALSALSHLSLASHQKSEVSVPPAFCRKGNSRLQQPPQGNEPLTFAEMVQLRGLPQGAFRGDALEEFANY